MKRWLCALLAALLAAVAVPAAAHASDASREVIYWTTPDDPCYHALPDCGASGAVRVSAAFARDYGKQPCARCMWANLFAVTPDAGAEADGDRAGQAAAGLTTEEARTAGTLPAPEIVLAMASGG